jgi:hypothetical protein
LIGVKVGAFDMTSGELVHTVSDDLEETLVSPVLVPRVHDKKVVDTVLDTPANDLDGMTSESLTALMLVDTALVAQEVFIDGESTGDWTVSVDILLKMVDVRNRVRSRGRHVLVSMIFGFITRLARFGTFGSFLGNVGTVGFATWHVMLALRHGVRIAGVSRTHLAASDDTSLVEPVPWRTDLTSVATHGTTFHESTAASGISGRHKSVEAVLDTVSVVESFGGTESPA